MDTSVSAMVHQNKDVTSCPLSADTCACDATHDGTTVGGSRCPATDDALATKRPRLSSREAHGDGVDREEKEDSEEKSENGENGESEESATNDDDDDGNEEQQHRTSTTSDMNVVDCPVFYPSVVSNTKRLPLSLFPPPPVPNLACRPPDGQCCCALGMRCVQVEEFSNPLKYIAAIRHEGGGCVPTYAP